MNSKITGSDRRPDLGTPLQRELWARAAGRCEFRGCNKLLYVDGLTQQRSNLATIAHIVSFSPNGARGDAIRSPQLAKDISNLMLTCKAHGSLIDNKDKEDDYPEDLLLEYKREHEDRIRMLTAITDEAQTHVLIVNAPIDGRRFEISTKAAYKAILPKYSDSETPSSIDLSSITLPPSTEGVFSTLSAQLSGEVRSFHARLPQGHPDKSISVFALAPIPLLVHLGCELGDLHEVDLYQRHRETQSWTWDASDESDSDIEIAQLYTVEVPTDVDPDAEVAIAISISASVGQQQIEATVGQNAAVFAIRARAPGPDFLRSKRRLELFGYEFRRLLENIRERYGRDKAVHLLGAIPSPVAIEVGRSIRRYHPPFKVYEYDKPAESYVEGMTINE